MREPPEKGVPLGAPRKGAAEGQQICAPGVHPIFIHMELKQFKKK